MMSRWRIAERDLKGTKLYAVYRVRDDALPDKDGNREYCSSFIPDEGWCIRRANDLNAWRDGFIKILDKLKSEGDTDL